MFMGNFQRFEKKCLRYVYFDDVLIEHVFFFYLATCDSQMAASLIDGSNGSHPSQDSQGVHGTLMGMVQMHFPKRHMGVSINGSTPKWLVFVMMENPTEIDDLGVPLFQETPTWNWLVVWNILEHVSIYWEFHHPN